MSPATAPRPVTEVRLLHVERASGRIIDRRAAELPSLLCAGDVLVVNDAATLPASLRATAAGSSLEVRLAGHVEGSTFTAVLFGPGDWRSRTEDRPPPPRLAAGARLRCSGLEATVVGVDAQMPRLVTLTFHAAGAGLWHALYRSSMPVQYSYLSRALRLWDVQTAFASRPWAVEPPSAALALRWCDLVALRRRGVELARVTHAAGLSSTGDAVLDARLPLPERFEVPAATVATIGAAQVGGRRVVAVGTTVVRALETAAQAGRLVAGTGTSTLRLGASSPLRVAGGILTGVHEPGSSHYELLRAFAGDDLLRRAWEQANERGYLAHEFGDLVLLL